MRCSTSAAAAGSSASATRVTDRPQPAALGARRDPDRLARRRPALRPGPRLERRGRRAGPLADRDRRARVSNCARPTPGRSGLFPEHVAMLPWLRERIGVAGTRGLPPGRPCPRHQPCSTCSPTRGWPRSRWPRPGAAVTHVDASRPTVAWARRNAELSGLAERPIRWIVDDAAAFAEREVRRGRRYAGVVLDPPSYGHGPAVACVADRGRPADRLLAACARLLEPDGFVLLTAHTPGFEADRLAQRPRPAHSADPRGADRGGRPRPRRQPDGRRLGLGAFARSRRRGMMAPMPSPTPPILTSHANPRIKAAVALRDRRERDRTGLTLVDGARELRRALDAGVDGRRGVRLRAAPGGSRRPRGARSPARRPVRRSRPTSEPVFARLAFGERAEGLRRGRPDPVHGARRTSRSRPTRCVVVIEGVEKPGNLGAVLRSADGAGADAVIAASPRTDLFNPNAIRASAGTIFTVPLGGGPDARRPGLARARAGSGSSRPGSTPSAIYTDADLRGPARDRARARGRRA